MSEHGSTGTAVPRWTTAELRQLLHGAFVFARNELAELVEVPEVLADIRAAETPSWADQLVTMHPEDRAPTVRAWWQAISDPGRPVEVFTRYRIDGAWVARRVVLLDLRHQPEVGVVVVGVEELTEQPDERAGATDTPATPPDAAATWDSPAWIVQHLDGVGTILGTEGRCDELFGRPAEELAGTNILDSMHPDDHPAAIGMWVEVLGGPGQTRTIRQRVGHPDGSWVWIESTVTNRLDPDADDGGAVVAVSHDISRRLAEEAALRTSREELRILAEEVPVGVFRADPTGRITYANARFHQLVAGLGLVEQLGDLAHDDHADALSRALARAGDPRSDDHGSVEVTARDGRRRLSLTWRRSEQEGRPEALLGVLTDVTDDVELRRRAVQDQLTGLLNRRGLEDRLAELLDDDGAVVAFVDLDGFKEVNDRHGHDVGDAVLAELGRRLATLGDLVAGRWGGDEFVLVVPGTGGDPGEQAARIGERVDELLVEPIVVGTVRWQPAASLGVAAGEAGDAPADLLRRADAAMYERKRARRGGERTPPPPVSAP